MSNIGQEWNDMTVWAGVLNIGYVLKWNYFYDFHWLPDEKYLIWCGERKCTFGLFILNYFLKFFAVTAATDKSIDGNTKIYDEYKNAKNPVDNQNYEII